MKQNKSQYVGTLKNSVCSRCRKSLNSKTRLEQDQHEKLCILQSKLDEDFYLK